MIPVIGIPYISRSDLMVDAVTSINRPVNEIVVVDNSNDDTCPQIEGARTIKAYRNMGVSWAWNTIIKMTIDAPYWVILNSDIILGEEDLPRIEEYMGKDTDLLLVGSMACFAISDRCIQRVGWFDEMFHPAYCEDDDYVYRCQLVGVNLQWIPGMYLHTGSATIRSSEKRRDANNVSFPQNVNYYRTKWGGPPHDEKYTTPFDQGGSPKATPTLDLLRLRKLSWD